MTETSGPELFGYLFTKQLHALTVKSEDVESLPKCTMVHESSHPYQTSNEVYEFHLEWPDAAGVEVTFDQACSTPDQSFLTLYNNVEKTAGKTFGEGDDEKWAKYKTAGPVLHGAFKSGGDTNRAILPARLLIIS